MTEPAVPPEPADRPGLPAAAHARLALLEALVDSSEDAIVVKDRDGRYLVVNRRAHELLGLDESVLGRLDSEVHPPGRAAELGSLRARLLADGQPIASEDLHCRDAGGRSLHLLRGVLRDAAGQPIGVYTLARDITERQRAEEELRMSSAQLLEAQRVGGLGHYVLDVGTGRWQSSPMLDEIFGLDTQAPRDVDSWAALLHPEDRDAMLAYLRDEVIGRRRPFDRRYRILRRNDGALRWVHGLGRLECDAQDRPLRMLGTIQDVTTHHLAEQALADSEQRLSLAIEGAALGLWDWDIPSGRVTFNERWATMLGWRRDEIDPHVSSWAKLVHPDDQAQATERLQRHLRGESPDYHCEHRLRHRDGHWVWVLDAGRVVARDAQGQALRAVGILQDISERRTVEEQLRKLSLAVEQSAETIVITDLDGRIEYVNEAFTRISGYRADEVIGQNPRVLNSGQTPPETYVELWRSLTAGQTWRGEFVNRRKDGSLYVESAVLSPIRRADGRITHYVAVKEDVSEHRRLTEELARHRHHLEELVAERTAQLAEARERAEAANRAKSAFLANVSHEIRTPMNAIVGLTRILRRSAGAQSEQALRLEKVETAAHHLLALINDVLDLSKIEAGRLELESVDFSLAGVLEHVATMVTEAAQAKGLLLRSELRNEAGPDEALPTWLRGDPTRLRQALLNFAGNAVKFTASGHVTLRVVLLGRAQGRVRLRFEVEDSGIGIGAEQQARIFEPFEQADASTTRRHGGTGLGLAIARRLVEAMGGQIGLRSRPGVGSCFWFTVALQEPDLPAGTQPVPLSDFGALLDLGTPGASTRSARADAGGESAEEALRRRHAGAHVLLAEDNAINRDVVTELLSLVGLQVAVARDGAEAVAHCRQQRCDLVLMDVQMPVLDGLEATRQLRRTAGPQTLPIIALTANAFSEDRRACLEAGMNDFLVKPVDPDALYAALLRWLDGTASAEPGATALAPLHLERIRLGLPPAPGTAAPTAPRPPAAAEDAAAALPEALQHLPGLDCRRGLALVRGRSATYLGLLARFAARHAEDGRTLARLLGSGERSGAAALAHTLAGVAGNLGAQTLQQAAADLCARLRGTPQPPGAAASAIPALARCQAELDRLVGAIRAVLPPAPPDAARDSPAGAAAPLADADLAALAQWLHQGDPEARRWLGPRQAALRATLGSAAAQRLIEQVEAFDFDAAAATLRGARH
ncbi:MAG: PAS domain S-box protein [Burkholderiaceae bacterium]|nr:PAS domain S-box protein [Burkholderiaceae bacterium]